MKRTPTTFKQRCHTLCSAICKLRALGRCELLLCGNEATDGHRLFFGKYLAYWQLYTNHHYFVALCGICHLEAAWAPHINSRKFWPLLEDKLILKGASDRLTGIQYQKGLLDRGIMPADEPILPHTKKRIIKDLEQEYKRYENIYHLDKDSQRHWGQIV